ncbi:sugar ABC transporter permease [Paenibacillus sp. IB182496]|uniref:Sugar ABC transporter permease n=1 Tax=Paenibacillus sabuli TaxID=2772509 RepID=A0A927GST7_9BACL|nr:sugar ABC transporter permease [Paenibacillus sabuli]MBD2846631.1 sugar ABC transporter permease [Paenibacillus sabuli]
MQLMKRILEARSAYFFILPAYFFFVVFTLLPLLQGLQFSFYDVKLTSRTWVGLDNFIGLYQDPVFWKALTNTVVLVVGIVPAAMAISLFIAVIVYPLGRGLQTFFRMAFYMPIVASGVALSLVWLWILNPTYGLLNYVLGLLGAGPVAWLGTPNMALLTVDMVVITMIVGQPVILYIAALGGIPRDLYESAMIDGAGAWRQFRSITLPLLKPTTLFVLVTQTIGVFQVFVVIHLMTGGGPAHGTQTIVYRMYQTGFDFFNFGTASALGVVLILLVSVVAWAQFKWLGQETEY